MPSALATPELANYKKTKNKTKTQIQKRRPLLVLTLKRRRRYEHYSVTPAGLRDDTAARTLADLAPDGANWPVAVRG